MRVKLAVLIGTPLKHTNEDRIAQAIAGYCVALDLTLRELQTGFIKVGSLGKRLRLLMALIRCQVLSRRLSSAICETLTCR